MILEVLMIPSVFKFKERCVYLCIYRPYIQYVQCLKYRVLYCNCIVSDIISGLWGSTMYSEMKFEI